MPKYKFYSINISGHIFQPPATTDYADDLTAIKNAQQRLNGHDIEIWEGGRIIAYLVPEPFPKRTKLKVASDDEAVS